MLIRSRSTGRTDGNSLGQLVRNLAIGYSFRLRRSSPLRRFAFRLCGPRPGLWHRDRGTSRGRSRGSYGQGHRRRLDPGNDYSRPIQGKPPGGPTTSSFCWPTWSNCLWRMAASTWQSPIVSSISPGTNVGCSLKFSGCLNGAGESWTQSTLYRLTSIYAEQRDTAGALSEQRRQT